MKCKVVRHQVLASETPARPSDGAAHHLARCLPCREWHRRLVTLEQLVPEIAVPPSALKADCLHAVLHSGEYELHGTAEVQWKRHERAIRKVAITFAMAAGLLFFALIWYAWHHQQSVEVSNLNRKTRIERIVQEYDRGALTAAQPRERVERLAVVAQKLHERTKERLLFGAINDVADLAGQFKTLVEDGILTQATQVPEEMREEVLGAIAEQFSRSASEAKHLSQQHPNLAKPLDDMAIVALNARLKLREMAGFKI